LKSGDILVSNFNNSNNLQGTGTTIVRISRKGAQSLFFQGTTPLGLSTALGVLQAGLVVVGNFPSADGTFGTATVGSLLVINNRGKLIQAITSPEIQGPWDMALIDRGDKAIAFVSNSFTGTVSRLEFSVSPYGLTLKKSKTIASGYVHRGDPVTFVVSPTGLVYDEHSGILYVASTGDNEVFAINDAIDRSTDAGTGRIVYQDNVHLHGALAMAEAPNGHLLVSNSDGINSDPAQPSEIVEFTKDGKFIKQLSVDPAQGGAFGLAVQTSRDVSTFAAVDDNTATLIIWLLNQ
jgi:DNA-binding beta-propeller fold protein YncE